MALNVARLDWSQLLKIQGFFRLSMLGLVAAHWFIYLGFRFIGAPL